MRTALMMTLKLPYRTIEIDPDGRILWAFSESPLSPRSMYIIYTPNLGLWIAVSVREREQGRFRGKQGGSKGRVTREH